MREETMANHRLLFDKLCAEKTGVEFQAFFERIMESHDSTFKRVKPWGPAGDWKCDGFSTRKKAVFQCYAPEALISHKTVRKIQDDLSGALINWKGQIKKWIFVWNHHRGLPPKAVRTLLELKQANRHKVKIEDWDREAIWAILARLPDSKRNHLLGFGHRSHLINASGG